MHAPAAAAKVALLAGLLATVSVTPTLARSSPADDPEVKANDGKPFHNLAKGTFTEDEIVVSGSRENTKIREYRMVLKRIKP